MWILFCNNLPVRIFDFYLDNMTNNQTKIERIKILHLEDDTNDAFLVQTALKKAQIKFEYFFADSEKDFKRILEQEKIDLILSDYHLPDFNGAEALIFVKNNFPDIPFVFVSGAMGEDVAIESLLNGATDYVLKNKIERLVPAVLRAIKESEEQKARQKAESELQKLIIDLTAAKEHAEESDHLKTAFLQNISHEIRTPMNAIVGFSQLLTKPVLSDEKRKNYTDIIVNSSNQLLSIVTDILTISAIETKQEKLNIGIVRINNVIVDLLSIFKSQAFNQNISLYAKQQLTDKQSEIYTDKTKVTQILTNLITNALKFTHKGFIEFGYQLDSAASERPADVIFYVKDTGIGIAPEQQQNIFERFRQADISITKKYGGTGLGLSISKGFTELLGGKIWVESEPEKGSTFYFTVPYKPLNKHEIEKVNEKQITGAQTILIAEDEEFNFLYIEELLINQNYKLIHAKNGQDAIDKCISNPEINLILMDIKMPVMDGYTAANLIKEFKPRLPIIAQSAYALEHERERFTGNAFDDYITKPINSNELIKKIMKYLKIIVNS